MHTAEKQYTCSQRVKQEGNVDNNMYEVIQTKTHLGEVGVTRNLHL
jgi:hypothetical protein